jgi:hypothetical protein
MKHGSLQKTGRINRTNGRRHQVGRGTPSVEMDTWRSRTHQLAERMLEAEEVLKNPQHFDVVVDRLLLRFRDSNEVTQAA